MPNLTPMFCDNCGEPGNWPIYPDFPHNTESTNAEASRPAFARLAIQDSPSQTRSKTMEQQLKDIMRMIDFCRIMFENINRERRTCVGCGQPLPAAYHEHNNNCPFVRLDYLCGEYWEAE